MKKKHYDNLDRFYTKREIVKEIINEINFNDFDTIIEPSAWDWAFIDFLPKNKKIVSIDIEPWRNDIQKWNFLDFTYNKKENEKVLVIWNPPYWRQSSLALKFLNHSMSFADCVAFILPSSFKKQSFHRKISHTFSVLKEITIPKNWFLFDWKDWTELQTTFQIWIKKDRLKKEKYNSKYIDILSKNEIEKRFSISNNELNRNNIIAFRRVWVNAWKFFLDYEDRSKESHYFITLKNVNNKWLLNIQSVIDILNKCDWSKYKNNTVRILSISKEELSIEFDSILENQ